MIVLDVAFPAQLWVLDGAHLGLGSLDVSSQHPAQRADEARGLAECIEKVLRLGDINLIGNEAESKRWLDKYI
ncbi:MAG: hypothetical protein AB1441_06285 [Bacillota bacterium]